MLVAVRQGQRRDAVATREERQGGCAAGKSKYIRLHRNSGKLVLAPMHLRRARVVGRSFAAGAQPLTHVWTVGAAKKTRRGPPAALLGEGVCRRAWGDGAHRPSGRHGAKTDSLNHHAAFKFSRARLFQNSGSSRPPVTTSHQNPEFYVQRSSGFCWALPVV